MAGHSKWANIKHRKGAQDARRSRLFTKLIKEISIAARTGSPEPENNPRLRLAIQNARGANVPNDNIQRALKKAAGEDGARYHELTYEGYGPHGVAIFVEASTDNINRTVSNVRSYFNKMGGSLGKHGSLEHLFNLKGEFQFELPENMDREELELELIDAGAEEVDEDEGQMLVYCAREDFGRLQEKFDELGIELREAGLRRIPVVRQAISPENFASVNKLIELLEDDDDVQKVYHDMEITEEMLSSLDV